MINLTPFPTQYGSVKEFYPLRQTGGAGDAGEAGGEKKAYLNRIAFPTL